MFCSPLLYKLWSTSSASLDHHTHGKSACSHFLQRFNVLAHRGLVAFSAVRNSLSRGTGPDFAFVVAAALQAARTHRNSLYRRQSFREFLSIEVLGTPFINAITFDEHFIPFRQLSERSIANCATATPQSTIADLILHILKGFSIQFRQPSSVFFL